MADDGQSRGESVADAIRRRLLDPKSRSGLPGSYWAAEDKEIGELLAAADLIAGLRRAGKPGYHKIERPPETNPPSPPDVEAVNEIGGRVGIEVTEWTVTAGENMKRRHRREQELAKIATEAELAEHDRTEVPLHLLIERHDQQIRLHDALGREAATSLFEVVANINPATLASELGRIIAAKAGKEFRTNDDGFDEKVLLIVSDEQGLHQHIDDAIALIGVVRGTAFDHLYVLVPEDPNMAVFGDVDLPGPSVFEIPTEPT